MNLIMVKQLFKKDIYTDTEIIEEGDFLQCKSCKQECFVSVKYIWEHNNRGTTVYRLDFYENKEKILYSFENVICNRGAPLYLRKLSTEELLEL